MSYRRMSQWTLEGLLASLPPIPPGHSKEVPLSKSGSLQGLTAGFKI